MRTGIHEDFASSESLERSSDRAFGFVFALLFALIALWPLMRARPLRTWPFGISALFFVLALLAPGILRPLNIVWFRWALLMRSITNPVLTALIFYLAFLPMGILLRIFRKDILRLQPEAAAATYWLRRQPPGPPPQSMLNQF
jgi:hypothetical protein